MGKETCLLCFAVNRRCFNIHNTILQPILERFTSFKIQNATSYLLCFICFTRLKQTQQLLQVAEEAVHLLQNYLSDKRQDTIAPKKSLVDLSITNVTNISIVPVVKYESFESETWIEKGHTLEVAEDNKGAFADDEIKCPSRERLKGRDDPLKVIGTNEDIPEIEDIKTDIEVDDFTELTRNEQNYDFEDIMEDSVPLGTNCEESRDSQCEKDSEVDGNGKALAVNERLTFKCDNCDAVFREKMKLKDHLLRAHLCKSFYCRVCGRPYRHRYLLIRHERSHTRQKQYHCDICKRNYAHRTSLKTHMLLHSGDKPYSCGICHRSFTQKGSVKSHMRTHTGEKPFSCDHCEKKFSHISSLHAHIRTHTGERPFVCDICNRDFSQPHVLKEHRRIHTGEKPYACDICPLKFPNQKTLKTHARSHTE